MMPDPTRRRALLAVASGAAALAGCTGDDDPPTIERPSNEQLIQDYEVRQTRNEDGAVLFAQGEELPTVTDDERGRTARSARAVITTEETLAELTFADLPEAEALREFAAATEFDSSSLDLLSMPISACYDPRLQSVSVELEAEDDLQPHADFCREYRPADVECRPDDVHTVGIAIRLPIAAERSTGGGRGMSSTCREAPRDDYFDGNVTSTSGGENE